MASRGQQLGLQRDRSSTPPTRANHSCSPLQQVDDILGEESDNESEGRGKEKPGNEEDEEQQQRRQQEEEEEDEEEAGTAEGTCREAGPQASGPDEGAPEPSSQNSVLDCELR